MFANCNYTHFVADGARRCPACGTLDAVAELIASQSMHARWMFEAFAELLHSTLLLSGVEQSGNQFGWQRALVHLSVVHFVCAARLRFVHGACRVQLPTLSCAHSASNEADAARCTRVSVAVLCVARVLAALSSTGRRCRRTRRDVDGRAGTMDE